MMKLKIALVSLAALALVIPAQADLGFQFQHDGIFGPGGDFATGPYPTGTQTILVLWSADAGAVNYQVAPGAPTGPGETVLFTLTGYATGGGGMYGYVQPATFGTLEMIGDNSYNTGFMFSRMFNDDSPADTLSDWYFVQPALDTSTVKNYVPSDPSTIFTYGIAPTSTGGQEATAVVPEPGTLVLCGLGLLALAVRRFRR